MSTALSESKQCNVTEVVCAWCRPGYDNEAGTVSHGMCEACRDRELAEFRERLDREKQAAHVDGGVKC